MRKPTGCIEHNPTPQSVKFCGRYINLSEISRTSGIHQSALSRIFSGARKPTLTPAISIAKALGMRLEPFLAALDKHTSSATTKAQGRAPQPSEDVTAGNLSSDSARRNRQDDQGVRVLGKPREYGKVSSTPRSKSELLEAVKKRGWWLEQGQAIDELCRQYEMKQSTIADLTDLSEETIGKQRMCFLNLKGTAREMCRSGKMHADASCSLAHAVSKDPDLDQESVMRRAIAHSAERDRERLKQGKGLKGRRTFLGRITNKDMVAALLEEKYKSD